MKVTKQQFTIHQYLLEKVRRITSAENIEQTEKEMKKQYPFSVNGTSKLKESTVVTVFFKFGIDTLENQIIYLKNKVSDLFEVLKKWLYYKKNFGKITNIQNQMKKAVREVTEYLSNLVSSLKLMRNRWNTHTERKLQKYNRSLMISKQSKFEKYIQLDRVATRILLNSRKINNAFTDEIEDCLNELMTLMKEPRNYINLDRTWCDISSYVEEKNVVDFLPYFEPIVLTLKFFGNF